MTTTAPVLSNILIKAVKNNFDSKNSDNNKEDVNFDYDGSKILIANSGKVKSNINILKTQYKFPRERTEDKKQLGNKKLLDKIDYAPRLSRNHLELNNKTISDFGTINQSIMLKEQIEN
jgi:hypothetical protein